MKKERVFAEFVIPKAHLNLDELIRKITEGWCVVCYLIINWRIDDLREKVQWKIPTEIYKELGTHLYNYVYEDMMPPAEIASTILNVADDFVRGEPVKLRAGDYIALQTYMRARK